MTPELRRLRHLVRLRNLLAIISFVLPGYWAVTFSGPFRWLARSAPGRGDDLALVHYLLCVLLMLGLLVMPLALHIGRYSARHAIGDALAELQQQQAARGLLWQHWVARNRLLIVGATLLLVGGGCGLHFWWRGMQAAALHRVNWHELEAYQGKRVVLPARADTRYWSSQQYGLPNYWVMLHNPHAPDQPVTLVARLSHADEVRRMQQRHDWEGIIEAAPAKLRDDWHRAGIALGEPLWVLNLQHTPNNWRRLGQVFLLLFGGSGTLLLGLQLWQQRRRPRESLQSSKK